MCAARRAQQPADGGAPQRAGRRRSGGWRRSAARWPAPVRRMAARRSAPAGAGPADGGASQRDGRRSAARRPVPDTAGPADGGGGQRRRMMAPLLPRAERDRRDRRHGAQAVVPRAPSWVHPEEGRRWGERNVSCANGSWRARGARAQGEHARVRRA